MKSRSKWEIESQNETINFVIKIGLRYAFKGTISAKFLKCTFIYIFCVEQLNGFASMHTKPVFHFYYVLIHFI